MKEFKKLAASWARSFLAGVVTLYLAGMAAPEIEIEITPSTLLAAGLAAVLPVVLRWLNPKDSAFGNGS